LFADGPAECGNSVDDGLRRMVSVFMRKLISCHAIAAG